MGRGFDSSSQTQIRPASANTPTEQEHRRIQHQAAVRCVATNAAGVDDCARLLDMLGLNPQEGLTT